MCGFRLLRTLQSVYCGDFDISYPFKRAPICWRDMEGVAPFRKKSPIPLAYAVTGIIHLKWTRVYDEPRKRHSRESETHQARPFHLTPGYQGGRPNSQVCKLDGSIPGALG
jgi:hypothetical protein